MDWSERGCPHLNLPHFDLIRLGFELAATPVAIEVQAFSTFALKWDGCSFLSFHLWYITYNKYFLSVSVFTVWLKAYKYRITNIYFLWKIPKHMFVFMCPVQLIFKHYSKRKKEYYYFHLYIILLLLFINNILLYNYFSLCNYIHIYVFIVLLSQWLSNCIFLFGLDFLI